MTYALYDAAREKHLGDVASLGGWRKWVDWVELATSDLEDDAASEILAFLEDGGTVEPKALAKALRELTPPTPDLRSITREIVRACREAEALALSDGTQDALSPEGESRDAYREDQERDEQGRFAPEGGGGTSDKQETLPNGRPKPIPVKSVEQAIELMLQGKVVELQNPKQVNTVLTRLAKMARDAHHKGEEAPNYDLCNVSVKGTNVFCGSALKTKEFPNGLPRIAMPQFSGVPVAGSQADKLPRDSRGQVDAGPEFIDHLRRQGIDVARSEDVKSASLSASQSELVGPQVAYMMVRHEAQKGPIFISRDNYIIDGHHNWAASVGRDAADNRLGDSTIRAIRVDAPIAEVLQIARKWSKDFGIKGTPGPKVKRKLAGFDPNQERDEGGQWTGGGGSVDTAAVGALVDQTGLPLPKDWKWEQDGEDFRRTQAIGRAVIETRTEQLTRERGLEPLPKGEISDRVWGDWRKVPTGGTPLAMQEAVARELGVENHLDAESRAQAVRNADEAFGAGGAAGSGMARLQAYVRAEYETGQFVLGKAGVDRVPLYRAIVMDTATVAKTAQESVPGPTPGSARPVYLPDLSLRENNLASTTSSLGVANNWHGTTTPLRTGVNERVVLRFDVPKASVFAPPVFGHNEVGENEVVMIGSKRGVKSDAWLTFAPTEKNAPMRTRSTAPTRKAASEKIEIDLFEIDKQAGKHWLSQDRIRIEDDETGRAPKKNRQVGAGGPGSGNFGHAGRPGEVGGSAEGTGGDAPMESGRGSPIEVKAIIVAEAMDFDSKRIEFVEETPKPFKVGDNQFAEAGHYDPMSNMIVINKTALAKSSQDEQLGVLVHEVTHAQYQAVKTAAYAETDVIRELIANKFDEYFTKTGYAKPEKLAELDKMFPAHAALKEYGDGYLRESHATDLVNDDGVSAYSQAYWTEMARIQFPVDRSVNETLAEVARIELSPHSKRSGDSKPTERWRNFARDIRHGYQILKKEGKHVSPNR